jgi:predicted nucleic acid-binding Zn ribbon protein
MTTYVYETIPQTRGEKPEYFELQQSMKDAPLTKHPESGKPIRRVVLGGYGVLKSGGSAEKPKSSESNYCCGSSGCGD